jgi:hypothetical protein
VCSVEHVCSVDPFSRVLLSRYPAKGEAVHGRVDVVRLAASA